MAALRANAGFLARPLALFYFSTRVVARTGEGGRCAAAGSVASGSSRPVLKCSRGFKTTLAFAFDDDSFVTAPRIIGSLVIGCPVRMRQVPLAFYAFSVPPLLHVGRVSVSFVFVL